MFSQSYQIIVYAEALFLGLHTGDSFSRRTLGPSTLVDTNLNKGPCMMLFAKIEAVFPVVLFLGHSYSAPRNYRATYSDEIVALGVGVGRLNLPTHPSIPLMLCGLNLHVTTHNDC